LYTAQEHDKATLKFVLIPVIAVLVISNLYLLTGKIFQASGSYYKNVYLAFPSVLQRYLMSSCSQIPPSD